MAEKASLITKGHVQLSSDINSDDETKAATPKAVKKMKDLIEETSKIVSGEWTDTSTTIPAGGTYTKTIPLGIEAERRAQELPDLLYLEFSPKQIALSVEILNVKIYSSRVQIRTPP